MYSNISKLFLFNIRFVFIFGGKEIKLSIETYISKFFLSIKWKSKILIQKIRKFWKIYERFSPIKVINSIISNWKWENHIFLILHFFFCNGHLFLIDFLWGFIIVYFHYGLRRTNFKWISVIFSFWRISRTALSCP